MISPATITIFDLDHTLARHDTYLHYLWGFLRRRPGRIWRAGALPFAVALFAVGRMSNTALKEWFLRAILRGVSRVAIEQWTNMFIDQILAVGLFRDGVLVLEEHRQRGDYLVLVSASPDCYVRELGERLGFDEVICTAVEWREDRLTGRLAGPNMRGEEKVKVMRSLQERFQHSKFVAYADNLSDLPMLHLADRGVLVNGTMEAQQRAREEGIHLASWV